MTSICAKVKQNTDLNIFKIKMANIDLTFCQYSNSNEINILIWHQVMQLEFIILHLHFPIKNVFIALLLRERLNTEKQQHRRNARWLFLNVATSRGQFLFYLHAFLFALSLFRMLPGKLIG